MSQPSHLWTQAKGIALLMDLFGVSATGHVLGETWAVQTATPWQMVGVLQSSEGQRDRGGARGGRHPRKPKSCRRLPSRGLAAPSSQLRLKPASMMSRARRLSVATVVGYLEQARVRVEH